MEIGKKLRQQRMRTGLTLEELASRTELSKGFLSQLENEVSSPSIETLNDIVEALGMDLASFFKEEKEEKKVFTAEDYFEDNRDGATIKWIVPNAQKNEMEPIVLELDTGARSQDILPHEGEELGYVLSGCIELCFEDESTPVRKGQTFYIKGEKTHWIENNLSQKARLIWVCTPPIF